MVVEKMSLAVINANSPYEVKVWIIMAQVATMNQAQLQILDMLSFIKTPETLWDLNKVISDYFVQMADAELDRMWNEGTLNEERIESFRHLHERTPYKLKKKWLWKECILF